MSAQAERIPADPHAVLVELVAAIEPGLAIDGVRAAIDEVTSSKVSVVRLAQAADRGLLTSGRGEGPPTVERFIRALQAIGAANVVLPFCGDCGDQRALVTTNPAGRRICELRQSSRHRDGRCEACGTASRTSWSLDRSGHRVCLACYKAEGSPDPGPELLSYLGALGLGLARTVLQGLISEITNDRDAVTRRLLWDLQNQPGLLGGTGRHRSTKTALLAEKLREAGAHGVPPLECPRCRRQRRLTHTIKRVRVCGTCYNHSTAEPCKWCGKSRPVAGRDDTGAAICMNCRTKEPAYQRACSGCGEIRAIQRTGKDGPLCQSCTKPPVTTCGYCGTVRPC